MMRSFREFLKNLCVLSKKIEVKSTIRVHNPGDETLDEVLLKQKKLPWSIFLDFLYCTYFSVFWEMFLAFEPIVFQPVLKDACCSANFCSSTTVCNHLIFWKMIVVFNTFRRLIKVFLIIFREPTQPTFTCLKSAEVSLKSRRSLNTHLGTKWLHVKINVCLNWHTIYKAEKRSNERSFAKINWPRQCISSVSHSSV